jgi:hypothetical protein
MPDAFPSAREQLLAEAKDRGRRWAEYRYKQVGFVWGRLPAMSDRIVNVEIHRCVADILPLDAFGLEVVTACYEAARDEHNRYLDAQRERSETKP